MKKLLMISVMLLVGVLSMGAQTYCYKYLFSIDDNGVKFEAPLYKGHYDYWTFANNKATLYRSDKNGVYSSGPRCVYNGSENGIIEYINKNMIHDEWYYFSSDYSRLNTKYINILNNRMETHVYEKCVAPEKKQAPTQLY